MDCSFILLSAPNFGLCLKKVHITDLTNHQKCSVFYSSDSDLRAFFNVLNDFVIKP